jgi:hypothetical protein
MMRGNNYKMDEEYGDAFLGASGWDGWEDFYVTVIGGFRK